MLDGNGLSVVGNEVMLARVVRTGFVHDGGTFIGLYEDGTFWPSVTCGTGIYPSQDHRSCPNETDYCSLVPAVYPNKKALRYGRSTTQSPGDTAVGWGERAFGQWYGGSPGTEALLASSCMRRRGYPIAADL